MISILLHMLLTPYTLLGIAAIALVAVGIYFTLGPVTLLKLATDIRTWFAIAAVLAVLAFAHGEKQNADLHKRLDSMTQQNTATEDAAKTTELRLEQKGKRATENTRVRTALARAKPENAEDAVMDAIAAERGDPIASAQAARVVVPAQPKPKVEAPAPAPDPKPAAPPAAKPLPEIKHVPVPAPQAAERTPDRAAGAVGDRLRKRPDVVVVP